MFELNDDYVECNECTGDFILPPPIFNIPPPPIPPELQNSINCKNHEDIIKLMKNWDNNLFDISNLTDRNFNSSQTARNLALLGLFFVILIMTIIVSVIYFKGIFKQKTDNLKNLQKCQTTTIKPKININLSDKNHYDECSYCNNYITPISSTRHDNIGYEQIDYYQKNQTDIRPPISLPQKDLLKYDWPSYYNEATMMLILQKEQEEERHKHLPILFPQHYESTSNQNYLRQQNNLQYSIPYECFHHNYPPTTQIELNSYCCCNSGNTETISCGECHSSNCGNSGSCDSGITTANDLSSNEFRIEIPKIDKNNYMEIDLVVPKLVIR